MVLSLLIFLACSFSLEAQVTFSKFELSGLPITLSPTTDLAAETVLTGSFSVIIQKPNPLADGTYFVTFSAGQSGNFTSRRAVSGGNYLVYQIYDDAVSRNILKDLSASPAASEVLNGTYSGTNANQTRPHTFTVVIPANQRPGAGIYTDTVSINLYQGTVATTPPSPGYNNPQTLNLSFEVIEPTVLKMSLVPTGTAFDEWSTSLNLNFGTVFSGAARDADLVIQGNTSYSVSVTSAAGGALRSAASERVPYVFKVNGSQVTLTAGTPYTIGAGGIPLAAGSRFNLAFTIGDFGMVAPGDYTDTMSFTVTAN